ncbi:hypothetical protein [uncultured Aquimarina sp.]|uniref:hypothetical protein n=1 Tax=uncultured Aquimarina sp. TaxID=575652 RepID=UPI002620C457|nr:hypothetical protein [uncultured Aquimarina sp.]
MLQYIVQTVLFQLIFMLAYDLFHKKDTFIFWNTIYKFLKNPKDNYLYVYLERYDTLEKAKEMLRSDFDGQFKEDFYILKIQ